MARLCERCKIEEVYGTANNSKYCLECREEVTKEHGTKRYRGLVGKEKRVRGPNQEMDIDPKWLKPRGSKRNG